MVQHLQRLSGLDASFLYLETPPSHCMCARCWSWTPRRFRAATPSTGCATTLRCGSRRCRSSARSWPTASSISTIRCGWRTRTSTSTGICTASGCPHPAAGSSWAEICGHMASLPLDRRHPLWETWVIEGVDGTDARKGGRLAVLTKVHHAAVDGVTGANLMSQLCSTEPDAPPPDPVEGHGDANQLRIALGGLRPVRDPAVDAGNQRAAGHGDDSRRHRACGRAGRPGDGRPVRRAADPVQRQRHRRTATSRSPSWTSRTSRRSRTTSASRSTTW